ncbi:MAG: HlyD family efflux transporter periplasmic adaptor subunit [Pseudomonadota bacterium]
MAGKKWIIRGLFLIVLLLPAPAAIRFLQTFVVRNAVVTAYRFEVRAPIDGVVEVMNARPGTMPGKSPTLIMRNHRVPLADLDGLAARRREKTRVLVYLKTTLSELEAGLQEDRRRFAGGLAMIDQDLDHDQAVLAAREEGEAARLKEATALLEWNRRLGKSAVVSQKDLEKVEADFHEAEAVLKATRREREQITHRRRMLAQGLFPPDISDGLIQVNDRIHSLRMKILDYHRGIRDAEAEVAEDEAKIQALQQDLEARTARAEILPPDQAVIWDVNVDVGMEVSRGDVLFSYIDRSRLMAEIAVDDATLELIKPERPVRIRMFGSGRVIEGKVIQTAGSSANWPEKLFAASIKSRAGRDGRVLVRIDAPDLESEVQGFCGVGRTGYAEFEGIGLLEQYFGAFLR